MISQFIVRPYVPRNLKANLTPPDLVAQWVEFSLPKRKTVVRIYLGPAAF